MPGWLPLTEDIISNTTCKGFIVDHFYVVYLSVFANVSVVFLQVELKEQ